MYDTPNPSPTLEVVSEEEFPEDVHNKQNSKTKKSKPNTCRNPWGNVSYGQLITQAIQSSAEKRLTLSQIYDWMITNVPYFQERSCPNSSAGWKNSIRHNLSLHQKFIKVHNEGQGKSSWWMMNPEKVAPNKPRRRATLGDAKCMKIKRDRAKRIAEQLKDEGPRGHTVSNNICEPSSPTFYYEDLFKETQSSFQRTPTIGSHDQVTTSVIVECRSNPNDGNSTTEHKLPMEISNSPGVYTSDQSLGKSSSILDNKKIKILEPRRPICLPMNTGPVSEPNSVVTQMNFDINGLNDRNMTKKVIEKTAGPDQVRTPFLIQELTQLTKSKEEISKNNSSRLTSENKQVLESTFDQKIRLLQEELHKITREEEIRTINVFSRASNNPFFKHGVAVPGL